MVLRFKMQIKIILFSPASKANNSKRMLLSYDEYLLFVTHLRRDECDKKETFSRKNMHE